MFYSTSLKLGGSQVIDLKKDGQKKTQQRLRYTVFSNMGQVSLHFNSVVSFIRLHCLLNARKKIGFSLI